MYSEIVDSLLYNEFYEANLAGGILIEALKNGVVNATDKGHSRTMILYAIWHIVDEVLEGERELTYDARGTLHITPEEKRAV